MNGELEKCKCYDNKYDLNPHCMYHCSLFYFINLTRIKHLLIFTVYSKSLLHVVRSIEIVQGPLSRPHLLLKSSNFVVVKI